MINYWLLSAQARRNWGDEGFFNVEQESKNNIFYSQAAEKLSLMIMGQWPLLGIQTATKETSNALIQSLHLATRK